MGMIIAMAILELPNYKMYWSDDWLFRVEAIPSIMVRSRFEKLMQYFHVAPPQNVQRGQPGYDPLHLVRPILDAVENKCLTVYTPHREQSIDEAMIAYKGRLSFKQYMPAKPTRFGIKVWERADPHNGYVCQFQVYTGKSRNAEGQRVSEQGLGARVVKDLTESIQGQFAEVYMDNFFSSPGLFSDLLESDIYSTGTCRPQRKGYPKPLASKTAVRKQGESKTFQKGQMSATVWYDKRQVSFLSTGCDPTIETTVRRQQKTGNAKDVRAPQVVSQYGKYMGGVDRADQLRMQYSCTRKAQKWWKYVFWFCIDTAISNSFIVMRESPEHQLVTRQQRPKERTQLEFRKNLAKLLIGQNRQPRKRQLVNRDATGHSHWPKKGRGSRCRHCLANKTRKESSVWCAQCNVPLCVDCFQQFHRYLWSDYAASDEE